MDRGSVAASNNITWENFVSQDHFKFECESSSLSRVVRRIRTKLLLPSKKSLLLILNPNVRSFLSLAQSYVAVVVAVTLPEVKTPSLNLYTYPALYDRPLDSASLAPALSVVSVARSNIIIPLPFRSLSCSLVVSNSPFPLSYPPTFPYLLILLLH